MELINNIENVDEYLNIYIQKHNQNVDFSDKIILLSDEDVESSKTPQNFRYFLGVYALRDILDNFVKQKKDASIQELIRAINFYIMNDAFIELDNN